MPGTRKNLTPIMSNNLNIRLFQADLEWQSPLGNMDKLQSMKQELASVDLLICPEMFTTGFSMAVQSIAEKWPGESLEMMKQIASETGAAIIASLVIEDEGRYFNRLVFVKPDRTVEYYDKRHLFTMGEEHLYYTAGTQRLIVEYKGWRILPLICYDLRFPVWSRNRNEYDLLVYVANWPDSRRNVWLSLLKARALENQAYVAGVNRVGKDAMGLNYSGDSCLFDARGNVISGSNISREESLDAVLDMDELRAFRAKFPVLGDGDDFQLEL